MKVAFHFDISFPDFGNPYGPGIEELIFGALLKRRGLDICSKVYRGDLPLNVLCPQLDTRVAAIKKLLKESESGWRCLTERFTRLATQTDGYVLCFDSITRNLA